MIWIKLAGRRQSYGASGTGIEARLDGQQEGYNEVSFSSARYRTTDDGCRRWSVPDPRVSLTLARTQTICSIKLEFQARLRTTRKNLMGYLLRVFRYAYRPH